MGIRFKVLWSPLIATVLMLILGAVSYAGVKTIQNDLDPRNQVMKVRQNKYLPTKLAAWLHAPVLGWLLLGIWLAYSAAMLWQMKLNTVGDISMCRYVPPK